MRERNRLRRSQPPVVVVLLVEHGFPTGRRLSREILDCDIVDAGRVLAAPVFRYPVALPHAYIHDGGAETRFLAELARRSLGERLVLFDHTGDDVPVVVDRPVEHQELVASPDDDCGLASRPQSAATAACSFAVASPAGGTRWGLSRTGWAGRAAGAASIRHESGMAMRMIPLSQCRQWFGANITGPRRPRSFSLPVTLTL